MKKFLLVFSVAAAIGINAQTDGKVGINTTLPQVTLDVAGKPDVTTSLDGLRAPQITGAQLRAKTYTDAQTGALVYVSEADTAPAGQTVDVTSVGYYYFNGAAAINKWVPITLSAIEPWRNAADDSPATDNNQNIYQNGKVGIAKAHVSANDPDLSIGGNGRATFGMENNAAMAAKNASGAYEDFLIPRASNGITFFDYGTGGMHIRNNSKATTMVITDNNLVGINNDSPVTRLDVVSVGPGNAFRMADTTQGEGKVLTSDANGKATWRNMSLQRPNFDGQPDASWNVSNPGAASDADPDVNATNTSGFVIYGSNDPTTGNTNAFTVAQNGWYAVKSRWFWQQRGNNQGSGYAWIQINTDNNNTMDGPGLVYEYRTVVNSIGPAASPPSGFTVYLQANTQYYVHQYTRNTERASTGERKFDFYFIQN